MLDIQTEFQLQMKTLRKELEDERQARIKLEAEVIEKVCNKAVVKQSILKLREDIIRIFHHLFRFSTEVRGEGGLSQ